MQQASYLGRISSVAERLYSPKNVHVLAQCVYLSNHVVVSIQIIYIKDNPFYEKSYFSLFLVCFSDTVGSRA